MEQKIPILEVSGVAFSSTVTFHLEQLIGRRLKSLQFNYGYTGGTNTIAGAVAYLKEIRFIANDRVLRRYSTIGTITGGTFLRDLLIKNGTLYDYTGAPNTAPGVTIPMFFSEPWRQDRDQRDVTAFPTVWGGKTNKRVQLDNMRVEIDLNAAIAGATVPTLTGWAIVDDVVPDLASAASIEHVQWIIPASSTQFDWSPNRAGTLVEVGLYPENGSGNAYAASRVKLLVNEIVRHDLTAAANLAWLLTQGQVPATGNRTANIYDIVADHDDNLDNAIPLGNAFSALLTITAANAMSGSIVGMAQVIRAIVQ
jgi:hypothetical protein